MLLDLEFISCKSSLCFLIISQRCNQALWIGPGLWKLEATLCPHLVHPMCSGRHSVLVVLTGANLKRPKEQDSSAFHLRDWSPHSSKTTGLILDSTGWTLMDLTAVTTFKTSVAVAQFEQSWVTNTELFSYLHTLCPDVMQGHCTRMCRDLCCALPDAETKQPSLPQLDHLIVEAKHSLYPAGRLS